ncbi:MAG: hypothetical protein ABH825_03875 [Candidatus Omnitrophota bacterium]
MTITVLPGTSSINIDTNSVDFGSVTGTVGNQRFVAGPVNIDYFAGNSPWAVRVYTDDPDSRLGLIGQSDPTYTIPLKAWCDNYGPRGNSVGSPPDEENSYFWNGYDFNQDGDKLDSGNDLTNTLTGSYSEAALGFDINGDGDTNDVIQVASSGADSSTFTNNYYWLSEDPSWLRVPGTHEQTNNPYTWRRLVYNGAELNPQGFPVYFAIDVSGKISQVYTATTLTFQIIIQ